MAAAGTTVTIDPEVCFGSGECVLAAPDAFAFDPDGVAVVVDVAPLSQESLDRIVEQCPSGAFSVQTTTP